MMKFHTIFLIAGLFFCCSCAKEAQVSNDAVSAPSGESAGRNESDGNGLTDEQGASDGRMTITVSLPEDLTRISLTQDEESADGVVKVAWEATDKLYINGEEFSIVTPLNENRRIATFTGPSVEAPYTILYGAATEEAANALILSEQTQNGNSSTAHLPYVAMLSGVNTLEDVCFNQSWATTNGGTLKQTGILRLRIKLPAAVTSVESLTVTAPSAVFYTSNACSATTNTLKLLFSPAATPTDQVINAYLMLPWSNVSIAASTDLTITAVTSDHDVYHRTEDAGGKTLSMGKVNAIKLTCDAPGTNVTLDDFAGGSGVDGDPYLLGNARQMGNIRAHLSAGNTVWFKMMDNIDLNGVAWTPINYEGSNKFIDFDGDGHTISHLTVAAETSSSYPSLFGVFYGSARNLTIDQAIITPGSSKTGVFAGWIGSLGNLGTCTVNHITISNSQVGSSSAKGTTYCGGFAGQIAATSGVTLSSITVTGTRVYSTGRAGGLAASIEPASSGTVATVDLSDITVSGCTVSSGEYAGGIIGLLSTPTDLTGTNTVTNTPVSGTRAGGCIGQTDALTTVSGCSYTGNTVTVTGQYAGGMVGFAGNYASIFADCHVENATIDVSSITSDPRAGGFAGLIENNVTVKGCSVGTDSQRVTVRLGTPSATGKVLNSGGFVGVHYGTVTKNGDTRTTAYATVTCTNPNTDWRLNIGGFGGFVRGTIEYADADVTMTDLKGTYIGGFAGYVTKQAGKTACLVSHCTLSGTVTGNDYTGGFVGYVDSNTPEFSNNTASCTVRGSKFSGGFAGGISTGNFSKCFSSSTVTGGDQCGGFIGILIAGGTTTVENCYATGNINAGQRVAGFIGQISDATASISNCYATGTITGSFGLAGLIGRIEGSNVTVSHCAAWNNRVTPSDIAQNKWSSGCVVGVAFPSCTLTDNYRKPDMALKAYWGNVTGYTYLLDADYQHANVSSDHKLVICVIGTGEKRETTATGLGSSQDGYPHWSHHGKVDADKTLWQLVSNTLGWDTSTIWQEDPSTHLPVLR